MLPLRQHEFAARLGPIADRAANEHLVGQVYCALDNAAPHQSLRATPWAFIGGRWRALPATRVARAHMLRRITTRYSQAHDQAQPRLIDVYGFTETTWADSPTKLTWGNPEEGSAFSVRAVREALSLLPPPIPAPAATV